MDDNQHVDEPLAFALPDNEEDSDFEEDFSEEDLEIPDDESEEEYI
ncbi:hypothetical protein KGM48_00595 [Patescibacteria group bacterium]|nr:hypothetical protein [Patescibacteria group bacterium]